MSAARWYQARPVDREAARAALRGAHEDLVDAHAALLLATGVIHVLADRLVPSRASDAHAERRVLGWLLSGRSCSNDFAELEAYDFADPIHRWIYAFGVEVLEAQERGALDGVPWPPELGASRETVRWTALLLLEDDRRAARGHAPLRTRTAVKRYHERFWGVLRALRVLPYPERIPQREIDLVAALGRAWSLVDQTYQIAPMEHTS